MPASARLFFGLPVDRDLRATLSALAQKVGEATGGRAIAAANLHATVAFIGSVPRETIADLCAIGAALTAGDVVVALDTVGGFRAARVAWIGPAHVPQALVELHAALTSLLANAAFTLDPRPYHPHVTLARHCRRPLPRGSVEPLPWRVERLVLYESVSAAGGPRYEELAAWTLTRRR